VTVRNGPGTKDGLTDADNRGTFFNGDFEVAGHAHRQLVQHNAVRHRLLQSITQGGLSRVRHELR